MCGEEHHAECRQMALQQARDRFCRVYSIPEGYRISESITEAIAKFPTPTSRSDLRSFMGLVNQLPASTSSIASLLAPLRPLMSTKKDFLWTPEMNETFTVERQSMASATTLSFFDPLKPTRICTVSAGSLPDANR